MLNLIKFIGIVLVYIIITFFIENLFLYTIYPDSSFSLHFLPLPSIPLPLLRHKALFHVTVLFSFLFFPIFLYPSLHPSSLFLLSSFFLFHNICSTFWFLFILSFPHGREIMWHLHISPMYFTYDYGLKVHPFSYKCLKNTLFMVEYCINAASFFLHLLADGSGCFQDLAIINCASINKSAHILLWYNFLRKYQEEV